MNDFKNELKYVNASKDKHDGIYNCSVPSGDYQIYDVTIMSPPVLLQTLDSRTTSVATSVVFNCSASGNPASEITWYRNGKLIENNYIINYDAPTLRINSVEPEDQGIYECFARNPMGEVKSSGQLTVRKKQQYKDLTARPFNVKCYPADLNSVVVTFESKQTYNMVNYYIASKYPFSWNSPPPLELHTNSSIKITTYVEPFKKYGIYLRGIIRVNSNKRPGNSKSEPTIISLTRMSDVIECATQGIPVRYTSVSNQNSIFLWWADTHKLKLSSLIVQFLHNDTTNLTTFSKEIVGTYTNYIGNNNYLTWSEIEPNLVKISAATKIIDPLDQMLLDRKKRDSGDDFYLKMSRLSPRHAVVQPDLNEGTISEVNKLILFFYVFK